MSLMDTMTAPSAATAAASETARAANFDRRAACRDRDRSRATPTSIRSGARTAAQLPPYKPGAHIDIHLPNGLIRQFSLLNPNDNPESYVVAIKLDPASRGGSRYIFDELRVGHTLKISAPRNNFPLVEECRAWFCLPAASALRRSGAWRSSSQAQNRSWKLYYACQSRADMAFRRVDGEIRTGSRRICISTMKPAASFSISPAAIGAAPANAHFYCCGPNPMLKAFEAAAASRPRQQRARRIFHAEGGSRRRDWAASGSSSRARARNTYIPEGRKILEVLYEAGVDVDYSCELGICGECVTRVISGIPEHHDSVLSEEEQASNEKVMICCAGCKSERLVLDM